MSVVIRLRPQPQRDGMATSSSDHFQSACHQCTSMPAPIAFRFRTLSDWPDTRQPLVVRKPPDVKSDGQLCRVLCLAYIFAIEQLRDISLCPAVLSWPDTKLGDVVHLV